MPCPGSLTSSPVEGVAQGDVQVCAVNSTSTEGNDMIDALLQADPEQRMDRDRFAEEQRKDDNIHMLVEYLDKKVLPEVTQSACKVISQVPLFTLVNQILYFVDVKQGNLQRVVVSSHLTQQIMTEYHSSIMSGHFSGVRLYNTLCRRWYWEGMYTDCLNHAKSCPQ